MLVMQIYQSFYYVNVASGFCCRELFLVKTVKGRDFEHSGWDLLQKKTIEPDHGTDS